MTDEEILSATDAELDAEVVRLTTDLRNNAPLAKFNPLRAEPGVLSAVERAERWTAELGKIQDERARRATLARELTAAEHVERQQKAAEFRAFQLEIERATFQDAGFWFKRFILALGIANAAAFAALAGGLLGADDPKVVAPLVAPAMVHFAWGMLESGAIPALLWLRYASTTWLLDGYEQPALARILRIAAKEGSHILTIAAVVTSVFSFGNGVFKALGSIQGLIPH